MVKNNFIKLIYINNIYENIKNIKNSKKKLIKIENRYNILKKIFFNT